MELAAIPDLLMISPIASINPASNLIQPAEATTLEVVLSFEEEFITGLIDIFYTHLEKSLSLILWG